MIDSLSFIDSASAAILLVVAGVMFAALRDVFKDAFKRFLQPVIEPWLFEWSILAVTLGSAYYLQNANQTPFAMMQLGLGVGVMAVRLFRRSKASRRLEAVIMFFLLPLPIIAGFVFDIRISQQQIGNFIISHSFHQHSGSVDSEARLVHLSQEFRDIIAHTYGNVLDVYPESLLNYRANLHPYDTSENRQDPRIRLENVVRDIGPQMNLIVKPHFTGEAISASDWVHAQGLKSEATVIYLKSALDVLAASGNHANSKFEEAEELKVRRAILLKFHEFRAEELAEDSELTAIEVLANAPDISDDAIRELLDQYLINRQASVLQPEGAPGLAQINNNLSFE